MDGHLTKFKGWGVEIEASKIEPEMRQLPVAVQTGPTSSAAGSISKIKDRSTAYVSELSTSDIELQQARGAEYSRTRDLVLVHVLEPSKRPGQKYDIVIYLMRHVAGSEANQRIGFENIKKAEFYFGKSWGDRIFTAENQGEFIGVQTSAWGSFLAVCRVTFTDDKQAILFRYIDFEMAPERKQSN